MRKSLLCVLVLAASAMMLAGCGGREYVKLPEYKGLEINVPLLEGEELEAATAQLYFNYVWASEQVTDRPVRKYDLANIDYEGKKDGVAFSGGTAQGTDLLIGSNQFISGFEDGLIGVMPGETVDLNLRFPDAYGNAELAGQDVVFTVTVNYISEMQDAQVASIGIAGVETLDRLRQYVAESDYLSQAESEVMNKLLEEAVFDEELPKDLISANRQIYADFLTQLAQVYGMDAASFAAVQGLDYESLLEQYAELYTKQQLVIEAIAEQEGMNLSDDELDARLEEYAAEMGMTVEELLSSGATKENFREDWRYKDVIDFLVDHAVNTAAK